ncbi:Hpt domain-containing protein [Bizionia paragorgiae]|uniref:Hpt domain-containing protein n=1 Tax=Bizionia paragorgiae TaxID=283786 RepID=A0A1H3ZFX8_BIZPA|nr:Hpt domain-containing protein [Bizionia paragorgiae]SEA22301.1 Hpt domain-containing protein [Bizionia paragorgiae]
MKISNTSYVDLGPLQEEVEGNMMICKLLINSFIKDIDDFVSKMTKELQADNLEGLYHAAHKIIPSLRIFRVEKLEPIMLELERELRGLADLEEVKTKIYFSLTVFTQVKVELQNEITRIDDEAT